jgi:hypothetical protein
VRGTAELVIIDLLYDRKFITNATLGYKPLEAHDQSLFGK